MSENAARLRIWTYSIIILVLFSASLNVAAVIVGSYDMLLLLWLGFSSIVMAFATWQIGNLSAPNRYLAFSLGAASTNFWLAFLYLVGNALDPTKWGLLGVPLGFLIVALQFLMLFAVFTMQGNGAFTDENRWRQRWLTIILTPVFYAVGLLVVSLASISL